MARSETDIARAIGPTDVHVVNHHGSIEVENPFWLATLRSRVLIVPAWSATHPSPDALKRLLAPRLYEGPRDVFVTVLRDETKAAIGARAMQVASDHGHVVVRVEAGGRQVLGVRARRYDGEQRDPLRARTLSIGVKARALAPRAALVKSAKEIGYRVQSPEGLNPAASASRALANTRVQLRQRKLGHDARW